MAANASQSGQVWVLQTDQPGGTDAFDSARYTDAIARLVTAAPPPFTLGLFGPWGHGKTTVVGEALRERLTNEYRDVAYVYFDCWKYQGDPLRRQLVVEAAAQLRDSNHIDNKTATGASRDFYEAIGRVETVGARPTAWTVATVVGYAVVSATLFVAALILIRQFGSTADALSTEQALPTFVATVLAALAGIVFARGTITVTRATTTEPEVFEQRLSNLVKASKSSRIVIVIDNLDRTDDDRVIETIATLKSFVESGERKIVYVVACDDEAIRRVLARAGHADDKFVDSAADEFLRKFFNTGVRLSDNLEGDVRAYAMELIARANIASEEVGPVADVLLAALRRSPRRMKQLTNLLVARLTLLSSAGSYPRPCAVAKILVIEEEWPDFAKEVRERPRRLAEETTQAVMGASSELPTDLTAFLATTSTINVEDPVAIFENRSPDRVYGIPDAASFRSDLLLGNWEAARQRTEGVPVAPYVAVAIDQISRSRLRPIELVAIWRVSMLLAETSPLFADVELELLRMSSTMSSLRQSVTGLPPRPLVRLCLSQKNETALPTLNAVARATNGSDQEWSWETIDELCESDDPRVPAFLDIAATGDEVRRNVKMLRRIAETHPAVIQVPAIDEALAAIESQTFDDSEDWHVVILARPDLLDSGRRTRLWTRVLSGYRSDGEPAHLFLCRVAVRAALDESDGQMFSPPTAIEALHTGARDPVIAPLLARRLQDLDPGNARGVASSVGSVLLKLADEQVWLELSDDAELVAWLFHFQPVYLLQGIRTWDHDSRMAVLHAIVAGSKDRSALVEPLIRDDARDLLANVLESIRKFDEVVAPSALALARKIIWSPIEVGRFQSLLALFGRDALGNDAELKLLSESFRQALDGAASPEAERLLARVASVEVARLVGSADAEFSMSVERAAARIGSDGMASALVELAISGVGPMRPVARKYLGDWLQDQRSNPMALLEGATQLGLDDPDSQRAILVAIEVRLTQGSGLELESPSLRKLMRSFRARHGMTAYKRVAKAIGMSAR